jgi:hypothetical protein
MILLSQMVPGMVLLSIGTTDDLALTNGSRITGSRDNLALTRLVPQISCSHNWFLGWSYSQVWFHR